jgi:putative two-component system response regulator
VGLPDILLKKPGKYTPEEFVEMQEHVEIGARMLDYPDLDPMAKNIALYHHEKWDGSGYKAKLTGDSVPIEARIVAVADVYDALSTKRVYKDPFEEPKIDEIIRENRGTHFEPALVDLYFENKQKFIEIKTKFSD